MDTIPFSSARAKLEELMDRVCEKHEPLIITRKGKQSVIIMSLEDYRMITEVLPRLDELENGTVQTRIW
jgi:antitoxin YefM